MTKRFQQNQRDKLKEHFKNHIFYRLCREVRDVFLQQYPAIIISTENLFVDAAKELDIILSDGDIDADYCKDMWTNSLTIYREQVILLPKSQQVKRRLLCYYIPLCLVLMLSTILIIEENYKGLCMKVFIKCGNVITSQPVLQ